jgi:uncharacterized protein YecE (DUF72 family)
MEFGKVQYVDNIDFSMPPDDPFTTALWDRLQPRAGQRLRVHVGGTEWGRVSWVGSVYPKGAKPTAFLMWYGRQFNTVELNTLFYGLQSPAVIGRWASAVGEGFRFCPKFPEAISHKLQLSGGAKETTEFAEAVRHFGGKLGPAFLQLSDSFGPDRAGTLREFVRRLPPDLRVVVELRHEGWFKGDPAALRETWETLRECGAGTVITDVAGRRDVLHMRLTAPVAFIRFVTNGLHPTDFARADAWVERLSSWAEKGLQEVYIFVHSPEELTSPPMIAYLIDKLNARCGAGLPAPQLVNGGQPGNLSLF